MYHGRLLQRSSTQWFFHAELWQMSHEELENNRVR